MLIQLESMPSKPKPRKLFYSYSHKDESLREDLDEHLTQLKREGFLSGWHDRMIRPGDEWDCAISENLNSADVILFLVSPSFLASKYCRDIEVRRAMERYHNGEATVVPVILKPCVYAKESFAKLEALPKTGRPLCEWPDSGFAKVAEELRVLLLELNYPRLPEAQRGGMHGHWNLKIRDNGRLVDHREVDRIVERLKEFTKDYSIALQAIARSQVADGEKTSCDTILILNGSPEALNLVLEAKDKGTLSALLDVEVASFYLGYGAVVHGSVETVSDPQATFIETGELLMRPGKKLSSCLLKGLKSKDADPTNLNFIVDSGEGGFEETLANGNYAKQIDYFVSALTVKEEHMWVNLSAYEADRMLPAPLAGTQFGRDLLSQDVVLKQLTASFMHPDSPVGRAYWDEVFARARSIYGTSNLRLNSFQKVWIVPKKALVYEMPFNEPSEEVRERFDVEPGERLAFICETDLETQCECDLLAMKHHADAQSANGADSAADFTVDVFKEIVLPHIRKEVNESEHFVPLRQIYHALILATWYKKKLRGVPAYSKMFDSIDSDNPGSFVSTIRSVQGLDKSMRSDKSQPGSMPARRLNPTRKLDHATPNAPAFEIPDNVEFYQKYIQMFRNGVFRCARSEEGDHPGEIVNRLYFSGAIRFDALPLRATREFQNTHSSNLKK